MAATKAQEKSRKQLYLVIGLGAVFAVLVAIQAPKFLGGGSEAAPEVTTPGVVPSPSPSPSPAPGPVNASGSGAVVGGVTIVPEPTTQPGEGQLASFSLFDYHDPFVQVVKETTTGSQDGEPAGAKASSGAQAGGAQAGGASGAGNGGTSASSGNGGSTGTSSGGGTTVVSVGPSGVTSASSGTSSGTSGLSAATIWVNGRDESVEIKKRFPKTDPTFVLLELKARVATIGVVGGSFTGSKAITLKMGQSLTLVNTATGARYTLRLMYTGTQPEQVQPFTQGQN